MLILIEFALKRVDLKFVGILHQLCMSEGRKRFVNDRELILYKVLLNFEEFRPSLRAQYLVAVAIELRLDLRVDHRTLEPGFF